MTTIEIKLSNDKAKTINWILSNRFGNRLSLKGKILKLIYSIVKEEAEKIIKQK